MMFRTLSDVGPWEVAAFVDTNGVCAFHVQLEALFVDPNTRVVACGLQSQFDLIAKFGPTILSAEAFQKLSDSIHAIKRDRFRVVGFLVEKRFVACTLHQLMGRTKRLDAAVIAAAELELRRYRANNIH